MKKRVCNRIRKLREEKGLTQEFMSIKLDMSPTNYAKIERNEIEFNVTRLITIAKILNVDVGYFFSR